MKKLSEIAKEGRIIEEEIGLNLDAVMHKLTQEAGEFNNAIQKYRGIYSKSKGSIEYVKAEIGDFVFNLISIMNRLKISPDEIPLFAENTLEKFKERKDLYK